MCFFVTLSDDFEIACHTFRSPSQAMTQGGKAAQSNQGRADEIQSVLAEEHLIAYKAGGCAEHAA